MAVMHAVKNNAHAFSGCDQSSRADDQTDSSKSAIASTNIAEGEKKFDDDTDENETDAETAGEDNAGSVAVANSPSNKIWMELIAQDKFNIGDNVGEGRRVGGLFESFEEGLALAGGDV
jgi:hypothetical protein